MQPLIKYCNWTAFGLCCHNSSSTSHFDSCISLTAWFGRHQPIDYFLLFRKTEQQYFCMWEFILQSLSAYISNQYLTVIKNLLISLVILLEKAVYKGKRTNRSWGYKTHVQKLTQPLFPYVAFDSHVLSGDGHSWSWLSNGVTDTGQVRWINSTCKSVKWWIMSDIF